MNQQQSLLFPLRAAQKVGLPITRAILTPLIDQIIQHQRWKDALELVADNDENQTQNQQQQQQQVTSTARTTTSSSLAKNQDLLHRLITDLNFPSSQWIHSLNFIKTVATSFPHEHQSPGHQYSSVEEFFGVLLRQEQKYQQQKNENKNHTSSSFSSFLARIAEHHLAPQGLWLEIQTLRRIMETVREEERQNLELMEHYEQQELLLRKFEMRALLTNGRWIAATKTLSDIVNRSSDENSNNNSSSTTTQQLLLPYPETVTLLKRMLKFNRWVEGVNVFKIAYRHAMKFHQHHQTSSVNNNNTNNKSKNKSEYLRSADILGASICLIATNRAASHHNHETTREVSPQNNQWWQALKALSLLQRNLPHLPVTLETIEAASKTTNSPEDVIVKLQQHQQHQQHQQQQQQQQPHHQTRSTTQNHHNNKQGERGHHHRQHHQSVNNYHNNSNNNNNNNNDTDTTRDYSRAVSVITDLARSDKWQIALKMLHQLNPSTTNRYGAGKCAGAIMVQMSKINNWEAAFRVYTSVVAARARITRCTKLQEADQRALLFVCAEQRRWKEAFHLLALAQGTANNATTSSNDKRKNNNMHSSSSSSGEFLFDTKPDRYGIAFNSRPPWNLALQFARNIWSKISSSESTKVAVLSGVAASALEHARESAIEQVFTPHHPQQKNQQQKNNTNSAVESSSSSLQIGIKVVERMFAQNLTPKGEVVALLPEKQALEVARSGVVPLVEMLLAIRICGHGRHLLDEELVEMMENNDKNNHNINSHQHSSSILLRTLGALNWSRSLKLAAAACEREFEQLFPSSSSKSSTNNNNSTTVSSLINEAALIKLIKYFKASAETLLACSTPRSHNHDNVNNKNNNKNTTKLSLHERKRLQGMNHQKKHADHFQHSLTFLSNLEDIVKQRLSMTSSINLDEERNTSVTRSRTTADQQEHHTTTTTNDVEFISALSSKMKQSQYQVQLHWEAALKIVSGLFDTLSAIHHHQQQQQTGNIVNNTNDKDDKNYMRIPQLNSVLRNDIRATLALDLHILSRSTTSFNQSSRNSSSYHHHRQLLLQHEDNHELTYDHPLSALSTILSKMENEFYIPYRWYIREHGPFGADSALRQPENWQVTLEILDYLLRCCDATTTRGSSRSSPSTSTSSTVDIIDRPEVWPPTLRDCFFHCTLNHYGNPQIAERGLKFFELMCAADDALRDADGKRVVELCAVVDRARRFSRHNSTSITSEKDDDTVDVFVDGWQQALQFLTPLQERNCLNSDAVSAFLNQFESQWLRATELFMNTRHRDAVFRTLYRQHKFTLTPADEF